jgi:hypothetical protein
MGEDISTSSCLSSFLVASLATSSSAILIFGWPRLLNMTSFVSYGILMHFLFFSELNSVLIRESHTIEVSFDDVLRVMYLAYFLSKVVGK